MELEDGCNLLCTRIARDNGSLSISDLPFSLFIYVFVYNYNVAFNGPSKARLKCHGRTLGSLELHALRYKETRQHEAFQNRCSENAAQEVKSHRTRSTLQCRCKA